MTEASRLTLENVTMCGVTVDMLSMKHPWGDDDVVLSNIAAQSYPEANAFAWWLAACGSVDTDSLVVDAGSYTGLYSLGAAKASGHIRVAAFEASALTYGRLCHNILLNKLENRIFANHLALSDRGGVVDLYHAFGAYTMASGESTEPGYEVNHREMVPAVSLSELFTNPAYQDVAINSVLAHSGKMLPIAAMKFDVEGAEVSVIEGAKELLIAHKPTLIIEVFEAGRLAQIEAILSQLDYGCLEKCPGENYVYSHVDNHKRLEKSRSELLDKFGEAEFRVASRELTSF